MPFEVTWSPRALDEIEGIRCFIARDSLHYSRLVVREIFAMAESIAEFPMAGRAVPEFPRTRYRERLILSYRLVYRIRKGRIEIAAVSHQARILDL